MTREEFIKDLTLTLHLNFDLPKEFASGIAEFLYDEDYRKVNLNNTSIKGLQCCAEFLCSECPYRIYEDKKYPMKCIHKLILDLNNKETEDESTMPIL